MPFNLFETKQRVIFVKTGCKCGTLRSGMRLPTPFQCPFCSFKKGVISVIKEFEETGLYHTNTKLSQISNNKEFSFS